MTEVLRHISAAVEPGDKGFIGQALSFVKRRFGFQGFRAGQQEILETILGGEDALVIMPTGGGKSLCYQVPAFLREGTTLVISPLIALMKDQVDSLSVLDLPVAAVHSLMKLKEQEAAMGAIAEGRIKLAYAAPERLANPKFINALKQGGISMIAVDEAHCISQWGHDFRPSYLRIYQAVQHLGRPQVVALTATATERVREDIIRQLRLGSPKQFITGFDRANLFWEVAATENEEEKQAVIAERLHGLSGGCIVYTGTRNGVEKLVSRLGERRIKADGYHAGLEESERTRVQERFMSGQSDVVVATNAFGMGIDRSDIRMVIHHTFPGTVEAYYQEAGRAGRDGDAATCLLLYSPSDRRLQEFFIDGRYPPREVIFSVYRALKGHSEDLVWLTYREIGAMMSDRPPELAVASSIKVLETAGAVQRLNRYDNRAQLFFHVTPQSFLTTLSAKAKRKLRLLRLLQSIFGPDELMSGVQFHCKDLAARAEMSEDMLRKVLAEIGASEKATYVPPFRGRGVRVCRRIPASELEIDFDVLQRRKAYELEKLDQVMAYAGATTCRRAILLRYFGEAEDKDRCPACDRCADSQADNGGSTYHDDPVLAVKILSGIARLKGRFGQVMVAKVLSGSKDRMIIQFGLDRLSTYGILPEFPQTQIQIWVKELISRGCVTTRRTTMGGRIYAVLELTALGYRVMKGDEQVLLTRVKRSARGDHRKKYDIDRPLDRTVFDRLRDLRLTLARNENLPAYCIFQDRTLREMAARLPQTREELLGVVGVGEVTLKKYGDAFLKLIREVTLGQKRIHGGVAKDAEKE